MKKVVLLAMFISTSVIAQSPMQKLIDEKTSAQAPAVEPAAPPAAPAIVQTPSPATPAAPAAPAATSGTLKLGAFKRFAAENEKLDATNKAKAEEEAQKAKTSAKTKNGASVSSEACTETEQESIPLSMLYTLAGGDRKIDVDFDQRTSEVKLRIPKFVSNCNDMIEWRVKQIDEKDAEGKVTKTWNGLEAHIRRPVGCAASAADCEYTYRVNRPDDTPLPKNDRTFQPNFRGYVSCLEAAQVIQGDGFVESQIDRSDVTEMIPVDLKSSGELHFVSHGPGTGADGMEYKFKPGLVKSFSCDKFENFENPIVMTTPEDAKNKAFQDEADKYRKSCDGYQEIASFLATNGSLEKDLVSIRDRELEKAAQTAVANIKAGKSDAKDIQVLADFNKYIVSPLQDRAIEIFENGEVDESKAELAEINKRFKQYNGAPYFTQDVTLKLLHDGQFQDAQKLNTMKLTMDSFSRVGTKTNGVIFTPDIASRSIQKGQRKFNESVKTDQENYAIRTGEVTGMSAGQVRLASRLRYNIETRTRNFTAEIQSEFGRMQYPNGVCYRYWVNTQKCMADSQLRVQQLQEILSIYNREDSQRAEEADSEAKRYRELEMEGRRAIATREGDDPEEEASKQDAYPDPQHNGTYAVNYNQDNLQPPQQPGMQQSLPIVPDQQTLAVRPPMGQYPQQQIMPQGQQGIFAQGQWGAQWNGYPQQQNYLGQQSYNVSYGQQQYAQLGPQFGNQYQVPQSFYGQQQQYGIGPQVPGVSGNYSMYGYR